MTTPLNDRPAGYAFLERPEHMPRGSLAGHVTDKLRQAIVTLKLKPGTMLDKGEICARLGVSRSPVAEAVAKLQTEGLIDVLPQRGSVVSLVSLAAVREFIVIRTALECEIVRILAADLPDSLIDRLSETLDLQRAAERAEDGRAFHAMDLRFHEQLLAATSYKRLKTMVDAARNNLDRARHLAEKMRKLPIVIDEHQAIVDALADRDGDRAAQTMRRHLDAMVTSVFEVARQSPALFSDGELAETASH